MGVWVGGFMVRRFCIGAVTLVGTLLVLTFAVAQDTEALSRAAGLFKNRQYNDVIRVLSEAVKNRPESEAGKEYLLLGESYYMTRQYELARPCFVHAARYLEGADKVTADYRLACTYYRINDTTRATEKIKEFLGRYPDDARVGKLLAYQMLILTSQGKPAEKEIEDLHKRIQANLAKYDYATGMEADEILCDFYRKTQQEDKAVALYTRIVNNFRQVAREYERDNRPLPATAKKSHDNAALQLGMLAMEKKNAGEAIKWFENIRYEPDLKQRARLFMAKLAYERQDYASVASYLTGDGYLDTVPDGPVKWDMYLILGLSAMRSGKANVDQVEGPLRKIPAEARGYHQAQLTLGNLYRDKSLLEYALKAFQNAAGSADYEATALLRIGEILLEQGNREKDELKARELYRKSGDTFGRLFAKYPLSGEAKQAREKTGALAEKGVLVAGDTGESNLKVWEKISRDKPGSVEAAQALMSLIRHHFKRVADEKSGKLLRAPDYAAAAAECDRLLDRNTYNGAGWSESNWNALQTEVLYTRAMCELASLAPPASKPDEPPIRYVKGPQAVRAAAWLASASKLVDKKQLDLIRSIEIALVEALFKSDRKEDRELAEKRYIELENNYGNDPRLQRLSLELADWYAEQKRFADAGRMLAGVASRGKDLPQEDMMKILYNAGTMFSRAGMEAGKDDREKGFWIRISPKSVVALGNDDLLKTYPPLRKTVDMRWPKGGRDLTTGEALLALSKAGKVPFTWATSKVDGSVAAYLEKKRVTLADGPTTIAEALVNILEFPYHRLEFAIGLTDGTPTLEPPKDKDDPETDNWKLIEIYDARRLDLYYRPASAVFGAFREVFGNKPALLYSILQRVEQVTGMRVVWAEGVDRQEKLATEFRELPGIRSDYPASVMQALNQTLDSMGLQWKIVARDVMAEHFEAAKEQFNRLRQIDPKSKYGERALLSVALNYYSLRDYARMKVILREYLKVFDNPENENRQMAAYWIGWVFEKENNFREAGNYYGRAAEERLVVYKLPPDRTPPSRDEMKKMLSYESAVALLEPCSGEFVEKPLAAVLDFCTVNSHIEVRADASAQAIGVPVSRPAFKNVPVFDVLADTMEQLGLTYRVENVNLEFAEKAYFRMVAVNRKDNAMPQALEAAQTLLSRFPQTTRRREVYGMMIDIYKGLKDYRKVLETMEQLQAITDDPREKQRLANEIAWIYFDVADYPRAMKTFTVCLESAQDAADRIDLRDGYARAAYRARHYPQALEAYETLLKEDSRPLRQFINNLMVYIIKVETGKADERDIPRDAEKLIVGYEQLTEALRARLAPEDVAKATWVYYALAKRDLKKGYADQAIVKLNACANSTDDSLAAEALYELGAIYMVQKKHNDARELLEELLFRGKGTDTLVRGTYALGLCYIELGRNEKAREKFQQLMDRYPLSPFVEDIKKNPVFASAPASS